MPSASRPSNCRLGWNITCRCGPALTWCHPSPSSGMVCCIGRGCGCSDFIRVSSSPGLVPVQPYHSELAPAIQLHRETRGAPAARDWQAAAFSLDLLVKNLGATQAAFLAVPSVPEVSMHDWRYASPDAPHGPAS